MAELLVAFPAFPPPPLLQPANAITAMHAHMNPDAFDFIIFFIIFSRYKVDNRRPGPVDFGRPDILFH